MLSVKSLPVPSPCGMETWGPYTAAAKWAMALSPILLSRAEVIHEPMPRSRASRIHSSLPLIPPCNDGFRIMYCGRMVSRSMIFSSTSFTPMSSSSRAIGKGVSRQRRAIATHLPSLFFLSWKPDLDGGMGCSIEWMSYFASCSSLSIAFSIVNPPLASTRSSICSFVKCLRICCIRAISLSQSIAPIFSFTQWKPACSFSSIRRYISSNVPIQMSPLMGIPSSPREKGVSLPSACRKGKALFMAAKAVSRPKSMEG